MHFPFNQYWQSAIISEDDADDFKKKVLLPLRVAEVFPFVMIALGGLCLLIILIIAAWHCDRMTKRQTITNEKGGMHTRKLYLKLNNNFSLFFHVLPSNHVWFIKVLSCFLYGGSDRLRNITEDKYFKIICWNVSSKNLFYGDQCFPNF